MTVSAVVHRLVDEGKRLFDGPPVFTEFTRIRPADKLVNDLQYHPHAFVLGCVMDRQVKAERAWVIPYRFAEKLGDFEFSTLESLSLDDVTRLMTEPEPLHRFPEEMSNNFYEAVRRIGKVYSRNAAAIWCNQPSSADVVYRFLGFRGVGPKIASMAVNILARQFKIPLSDYYSIDVSADVQVKRVFRRLGLIEDGDSSDAVIYKARALHPKFPGLLDSPAWRIGRKWCRPKRPLCHDCFMQTVCPTASHESE